MKVEARARERAARLETADAGIEIADQRLDVRSLSRVCTTQWRHDTFDFFVISSGRRKIRVRELINELGILPQGPLNSSLCGKPPADLIDVVAIHPEAFGDLIVVKGPTSNGE